MMVRSIGFVDGRVSKYADSVERMKSLKKSLKFVSVDRFIRDRDRIKDGNTQRLARLMGLAKSSDKSSYEEFDELLVSCYDLAVKNRRTRTVGLFDTYTFGRFGLGNLDGYRSVPIVYAQFSRKPKKIRKEIIKAVGKFDKSAAELLGKCESFSERFVKSYDEDEYDDKEVVFKLKEKVTVLEDDGDEFNASHMVFTYPDVQIEFRRKDSYRDWVEIDALRSDSDYDGGYKMLPALNMIDLSAFDKALDALQDDIKKREAMIMNVRETFKSLLTLSSM